MTFGAWLKRRRQQLDLTQNALAHRAGCALGTIRKIEADERRPSRQLAALLARNLQIPSKQYEAFISFARAEPYLTEVAFPLLAVDDEATAAVPRFPPRPVDARLTHNLPAETTRFIGRQAELAALDVLLSDPNIRLVTLVGPGGIDKTRIALACAAQQIQGSSLALYPQGVFFVDLAPLGEAGRLILILAETLGLRLRGGADEKRPPKQQLLDYLKNRRLMLLLDNFGHLLDPSRLPDAGGAAGLVAEILENAPQVQLLITSRERLNLPMAQLLPIEGLALPEEALLADGLEQIDSFTARYTSVQLFLQAAHRNKLDVVLESREELAAVIRICRLVEGMPLAIELAAAWVDVLSAVDIAAELQQGLDILETEQRYVPERQRSVRATFDYSWRRLDEKEQALFAQLSIFRGGFTRAAAQAVTGATLRQLSRLANKSFIQFGKKRDRYQVHELLRQYGADRLPQHSDAERSLSVRHSLHYSQWLAQMTGDHKGARQMETLDIIESDIENVRLAWNNALARQDLEAIGISLESLWRFYWNSGWYSQGENELESAVAALRTGEIGGRRGIVLGHLLAGYRGRYQEALILAQETVALAREYTFNLGPVVLGAALLDLGAYEEAGVQFQQGLLLIRATGTMSWVHEVYFLLGKLAFLTGDYERAFQQHQQSLAGALELDYLTLAAQNHDALGRLKVAQADSTGAKKRFRAALQAAATEYQTPVTFSLPAGRVPVLLASLASIAELYTAAGNLAGAATLALLITDHPASQAKVKERAARPFAHFSLRPARPTFHNQHKERK